MENKKKSNNSKAETVSALNPQCRKFLSEMIQNLGKCCNQIQDYDTVSSNQILNSDQTLSIPSGNSNTPTTGTVEVSNETGNNNNVQKNPQEQLQNTAASLTAQISQFTIAWQDNPEYDDCSPFGELVLQSTNKLVELYKEIIQEGKSGGFVEVKLKEALIELFKNIKNLAESYYNLQGSAKVPSHLTGLVWESCNTVARLTLDPNISAAAIIQKLALTLKDAINELSAVKVETKPSEYNNSNNQSKDEDEDEDDWDLEESETLSESEFKVVSPLLTLLKAAHGLVNALVGMLAQKKDDGRWLHDLINQIGEISKFMDDTVISVYPPQNLQLLQKNVDLFVNQVNSLLHFITQNPRLKDDPQFNRTSQVVLSIIQVSEASIKQITTTQK